MGEARIVELNATVQGRDAVIVDVGNPQCVMPVPDFDFDWPAVGAATERDPRFPNRTNVSFIRKVDANTIEARFWERGAGLTNSSGTRSTGAAAAALASESGCRSGFGSNTRWYISSSSRKRRAFSDWTSRTIGGGILLLAQRCLIPKLYLRRLTSPY